uniref:butyrophilin-like protein 1 n=1 Tax=Epinephelus lanceolatus TaxID=310571 RepID=UPI001446DF4B|nr:butyrophilin-like protein 1 [Epinephelus lanceolatus]
MQSAFVVILKDGNALLPCSLSTKQNIEQGHFDLNKVAQNNEKQKEVFRYNQGRHSNTGFGSQDEEFKGRVSHFQEELKHGNASIIIRNTRLTDSGNYTCTFTEPRQTFHIKLVVGGVLKDRSDKNIRAKKPFITALEQTKDWSRLQCEVHGASPKPKVEWKDSSGNKLPAEELQVTDRGGSYDIILQTTVTKTDYYHCVVTQEEINHQTEAKIHVYISGSTGWVVVVSVFCTLLVGGVILTVLVYKGCITLNCKKGSPADHKEGSAVPLNGQPSRSQEAPDPET